MDTNLLDLNLKKAKNQLTLINCRKAKIKSEIYKLYDLYLKNIRSILHNHIIEAVSSLTVTPNNARIIKENNDSLLINNDLKIIVNNILPFLTIEQLLITSELQNDFIINNSNEFISKYKLDGIYSLGNFELNNNVENINYYDYYHKLINKEKLVNIELWKHDINERYENSLNNYNLDNFTSNYNYDDNNKEQLTFEFNHNKEEYIYESSDFTQILNWFESLDSSLNYYLKKISIRINNLLFKNYLSKDLISYIFENNLIFDNPYPFILSLDLSLNHFINIDKKYCSKLYLLKVDYTELEYCNIHLNVLRNEILELKFNINLLLKKENYWRNKIKENINNTKLIK